MKIWLTVACIAVLGSQLCSAQDPVQSNTKDEQQQSPAPSVSQPVITSFPKSDKGEIVEMQVQALPVTYVAAEARRRFRPGGEPEYYDEAQDRDYKHPPVHHKPKKCHPVTVTKYKTVYKDRKANVFNKVEVRNPRPQVHKTKETRHTTIRYPVFITQVIKPLLTQVETKVKPLFFTKTLKRIKTIVFTVTGIGQVTVTKVKYEKEYVTRCQKKGYGHGAPIHHGGGGHKHGGHGKGGGYHRRQDTAPDAEYVDYSYSDPEDIGRYRSYEELYRGRGSAPQQARLSRAQVDLAPSFAASEAIAAPASGTGVLPAVSS